ncbi:MAG: HIT domain-containing protein [Planctomycetota bacterium]|nr:HIT domain-containing protein [Planctomycetota bacterium]
MSECLFCSIVAGREKASVVYQDNHVTAFMDIQPINRGHVLVVPNSHAAYLDGLDETDGARMFQTAQQITRALRRSSLPCEGVNLFLADGAAAGQEVFHVHLHVVPRIAGDGHVWRMADHYYHLPGRADLDLAAKAIRNGLLREEA